MSRILLILLFLPSLVFAYQIAYVNKSRALIYADEELKIPVGYLSKGKKIKVGDIKRNKGTALPVVLSERVFYIKVEDLLLKSEKSDEFGPTEKAHFLPMDEEEKESLQPIRLVTNFGAMDPGSQWGDLMDIYGGTDAPLYQLEALLEMRLTKSSFFFDAGFVYDSLVGGPFHFVGLGFKGLVQYRLKSFNLLDLDLNAGFHFAPGGAKLKYGEIHDNGNYYGYILGAQVRFTPNSSWNFNLGFNYQWIVLEELEDISTPAGEFKLNVFKGLAVYLGVSFPL